uniref:Protein DP71L n=1 Tax=Callorhinchus milii TaxID=7868 RepID=A0A4W3GLA2_CALMI
MRLKPQREPAKVRSLLSSPHPHPSPVLLPRPFPFQPSAARDPVCVCVCVQNEMASTCTNPVILSMICPPVDQSGQESDWSTELEEEEEEEEGEGSLEWLGENEGALLSDWSTDWEDSDGDDDEEISCEADDLWESFFVSDDPYNPLNFSARAGPPPQRTPNMADTETPAKGEKIPSDSDGKKPKSIKKVRFSPNVELHRMITWSFAYRAARKGPWEECGRDRCRFQRRIAETETIIGRCFEQKHRDAVWAELYAE